MIKENIFLHPPIYLEENGKEEIKKIINKLSQLADFELKVKNGHLYKDIWENVKEQLLGQINNKNASYISEITFFIGEIEEYSQKLEEIVLLTKKYTRKMISLHNQQDQVVDEWLNTIDEAHNLWSEIEYNYDGHSYDEVLLEKRKLKIKEKRCLYKKTMSFFPKIQREIRKSLEYCDEIDKLRKNRGQTIFELKEKLCEIYEITEN